VKRRLCLALLMLPFSLYGQVTFSGLDVSVHNQLLFQVSSEPAPKTLFLAQLADSTIQQLTLVPQSMALVENAQALYIHNAFGTMRLPLSAGIPQSIPAFPSFVKGSPISAGRLLEKAVSYDGQWVLFLEPVSYALCNLSLLEVRSGEKRVIAQNIEQYERLFPARWSPDSAQFVYSKGGKLYYYAVGSAILTALDEQYRVIGEGTISAIQWGQGGDFFYLTGSVLYRIPSNLLFARKLYADFLPLGTAIGTLPFDFNPDFDMFWIAPDYSSLVLFKSSTVFYYPLDTTVELPVSFPYLLVPSTCVDLSVLWSADSSLTVIASLLNKGELVLAAYRLNLDSDGGAAFISYGHIRGSHAALSPDGKQLLIAGESGALLYDYQTWTEIQTISSEPVLSALWVGAKACVIGGQEKIELVQMHEAGVARTLLCLASVEQYGFEESSSRIVALSGGTWFTTDGRSAWTALAQAAPGVAVLDSDAYRVFLERQAASPYLNVPMVRSLHSLNTVPLVSVPQYTAPRQSSDTRDTPSLITHGARVGNRDIALCFDLYEDAAGVAHVLDALRRFGWTATFFLNGEFIQRNPVFVQAIVNAGHETASLFFAPLDLSTTRYHITEDFIINGITRNEDEFYNLTGQDLRLLWHPPYYVHTQKISAAAAKAGYLTIGADIDPQEQGKGTVSALIDSLMEKVQPGSIIPIRLGVVPGKTEYLFNHITVLLDALKKAGYRVIPITTMLGSQ
jgi:hypothetical protein